MKKVFAALLAAALAASMGIPGVAAVNSARAGKITGFYADNSLIDGYVPRDGTGAYKQGSNTKTVNLGTISPQNETVDYIDLRAGMFVGARDSATVSNANRTVYYYLDTAELNKNTTDFRARVGWPSSWSVLRDRLVEMLRTPYYPAAYNQSKDDEGVKKWNAANPAAKIESMIIGMPYEPGETNQQALTRLYAKNYLRPESASQKEYEEWFKWYQNKGYIKESVKSTAAGALWFVKADGSVWSGSTLGNALTSERNLTNEEIRSNNIALRTQMQEESAAVKEVNLLRTEGRVEIKWTDRYVSTQQKDFLLIVALSFNGRVDNDNAARFSGKISNKELKLYSGTNKADISDGTLAVAVEFISKIALDVGSGVTVNAKLFKDKKYYGLCVRDPDESDERVMRKYPDVDNVLTLYSVGLTSTANSVSLSGDYNGYYVYDKDMKYLGRASEKLPVSAKYYLAGKRLSV